MTGFEIFIFIKNKLNLYLLDTYLKHNDKTTYEKKVHFTKPLKNSPNIMKNIYT